MVVQKNLVYGILDDEFIRAVRDSRSWVEVCRYLGLHTDNRKWAKKRAIDLGLDYNHLGFVEISKPLLYEAVRNSDSYYEVQIRIGKSAKYTKKLIKKYKISTKHFPRIKARTTKENVSDDRIGKLVRNHKSATTILNKLGLSESKENYQWIKEKCKDLKLQTKFKIDWARWSRDKIILSLKKLKHASTSITTNLIKYGLKNNECEICGQKPIHCNKPLVFQCHHIDGNSKNNSFENLQILCPNCHTQTDNYARSHKCSGQVC